MIKLPEKNSIVPADTILCNGRMMTVGQDFSVPEAVAIPGGKFLAVVKNEDIMLLAGQDTEVIKIEGQAVTGIS